MLRENYKAIPLVRLISIVIFLLSIRGDAANFTVPNWLQKSCVFIMNGEKPQGTGFLVWLRDKENLFCYLVTAKHVVHPILNDPNVPLSVRFNMKEEGKAEVITFRTFTFNGLRWLQHSNPAVDLAVVPLLIFKRIQDLEIGGKEISEPNDSFLATADWIKEYKVGPGDQVFILGLVPYLFAKDQVNLVFSRFGNVSLLPEKEIDIPGGKQKAYFLDCQSFGGNSGGPAFILLQRSEKGPLITGWRFALLGVVVEFVPSPMRIKQVRIQDIGTQKGIQFLENTGITKVVPVDYLVDILFSDDQKGFRKKIIEAQKKETEKKQSEL